MFPNFVRYLVLSRPTTRLATRIPSLLYYRSILFSKLLDIKFHFTFGE